MGISKSVVDGWVRSGWLKRRYRGVYAVGYVPRSRRADLMAAVLALGPDAVLSHISAAALWGMVRIRQPWIDVTAPGSTRSRGDIKAHRSRDLGETTARWGIPVKTPIDTVLDLADCVRKDEVLIRAINQGLVDGLFTVDDLVEKLADARGRHGVKRLRALLALVAPTRSGLEDAAFARAVRSGSRPLTNHSLHGLEVDQYDPVTNTVTEIDGDRYHSNPFARYLDAEKERRLAALGVAVQRRSEEDVG